MNGTARRRSTVDNPQTKARAAVPARHALDRQLDGHQLHLRLERHQPGLRRRQDRHVHHRLRRATPSLVQQNKIDPKTYGLGRASRSTAEHAASSAVAPSPWSASRRRTPSRPPRSSGSTSTTWRSCSTQASAVADAKTLADNKQPVGVPPLPVFDKATYDAAQTWIKHVRQRPAGPDEAVHRRDLRAERSSPSRASTRRTSTRRSTRSFRRC